MAKKLKELKDEGVSIEEIHIFDHGGPAYQECGNEYISPWSKEWKEIAETVDEGGIICLHGCNVAEDGGPNNDGKDYIQDLADEGDVTVEGYTGKTYLLPPIPIIHDHIDTGDTVTKEPKGSSSKAP